MNIRSFTSSDAGQLIQIKIHPSIQLSIYLAPPQGQSHRNNYCEPYYTCQFSLWEKTGVPGETTHATVGRALLYTVFRLRT